MYEYSKTNKEISNVNIDLRHEFQSLRKEFGTNILYVRNCKFVRCTCFDDLNKTGTLDCPKCFGSGFFASIQKFASIQSSGSGYSGGDKMTTTPIGVINQKEEIHYMDYAVLPKERDFILKVTWDKNNLPIDVVKVLEVINVFDMKGDNGRVELFGVQVEERADLLKKYDTTLHDLPKKAKAVLSKGDKYIWPYKLVK